MECHDARMLLSFAQRPCERLDATEAEALRQHLDRCPVCASLAQGERAMDEAVGAVLRDVPVPPGLKEKVLHRLNATRPRLRWKRAAVACAASLLLAVTGGIVWHTNQKTEARLKDVQDYVFCCVGSNEEQVDEYLEQQGLSVKAPRDIILYRYLQHVDVIEFKGRRVAKLSFLKEEPFASAEVLILAPSQFRMDEISEKEQIFNDSTTIRIVPKDDFVYVIAYHGNPHQLSPRPDN